MQIAPVSMPVREENREGEEERGRSVCWKLSLPCSIMGVLNTAKHFKTHFSTGRSAKQNDLYFTSGCEWGYRSPPLPLSLPLLFSLFFSIQLQQMWQSSSDIFFLKLKVHRKLMLFHLQLIAGTLLLWLRVTVAVTAVKRLGLQHIKPQVIVWLVTCSISH